MSHPPPSHTHMGTLLLRAWLEEKKHACIYVVLCGLNVL